MSNWIKLGHLNDIDDGCARGFDPHQLGRDSLFVLRKGDRLLGYRNACPHRGYEGTSMAWRKDRFLNKAGTRIICGAHGAQFDTETGECLIGPCPGQSLEKVILRLTETGELYLQQTPDNEQEQY
ncbi:MULTISPECIES: Rieske (2Fe-2S) protein [Oceanospirillaceae]|jgi:nitrite reductase/ring-hydroxylating ferredoxin subunit|uniref:Rieske 2Fe-2S domain-containing protein n=1 Tax=Oceanobacter antarcticus TaxID=3133425 RepID=A0ABW8NM40_9GAMM|tara:strand:- start:31252 stop:31626 length:375 start_codon:yes stop_codon:yes gene_type:complete